MPEREGEERGPHDPLAWGPQCLNPALTDVLSHTVSELSQLIVQILDTLRFSLIWGRGLGTTYDVHLGLIRKRFPISVN